MKRLILLTLLPLAGCGPSAADHATSQVNVLAEKLSQDVADDGWFKPGKAVEADPWGNPLEVKYTRHNARETLRVRSNGPDGLPFTRDDITSRPHSLTNDAAQVDVTQRRQKTAEGYTDALTRGAGRGIVEGVAQGWKDHRQKQ